MRFSYYNLKNYNVYIAIRNLSEILTSCFKQYNLDCRKQILNFRVSSK